MIRNDQGEAGQEQIFGEILVIGIKDNGSRVSGCRFPRLPGRSNQGGLSRERQGVSVEQSCRHAGARVRSDDHIILRACAFFIALFAARNEKHHTCTVQERCFHHAPDYSAFPRPASGRHQASPGSARLIPDSLIPDSLIAYLTISSLRLPFHFSSSKSLHGKHYVLENESQDVERKSALKMKGRMHDAEFTC